RGERHLNGRGRRRGDRAWRALSVWRPDQRPRVGRGTGDPHGAGRRDPALDRGASVTPRPPLLTLLASLIVHGVALSLLFVFASGESRPSALLVDLSEPETVRDEGAPRPERAGSSRAIRRARKLRAARREPRRPPRRSRSARIPAPALSEPARHPTASAAGRRRDRRRPMKARERVWHSRRLGRQEASLDPSTGPTSGPS